LRHCESNYDWGDNVVDVVVVAVVVAVVDVDVGDVDVD
jgi:hypothetical protein